MLARLSHILVLNPELYNKYMPQIVDFLVPILSIKDFNIQEGIPNRHELNLSLLCLSNLAETILCKELVTYLLGTFRRLRWGIKIGLDGMCCNAYVYILSCISKSHLKSTGLWLPVSRYKLFRL